ncbi:TetR/AcrR family transcriptional regulator [Phytoactinopolyspora alkaliphila]|uniref:TetR/AcrR family transcriptional regulator n=1 Tax=Phytoactinopolyspora alkaliphila TaxID=1783498 RepID=A0A6N9YQ12_9ACTN|nr:TetR/AcrR family transcriptional regulator [Phytoactinopolyspora alkaliphila]NED97054.1 TetR/AcrR family transcriptional regulator [Phytoactinopolyspora alkaliphila]
MSAAAERRTQADRRARTRAAILAAAARGLSTYGYANLVLEQVARDAGYTRGALYHLFANKEELAVAVVEWVGETWDAEVRRPALVEGDPLTSLMTMARGHALYCRRHDVARMMLTLQVEFAGQDHPVGHAVSRNIDELETGCSKLIAAGRRNGSIPQGPPVRLTARAFLAALEAVAIEVAGSAPHDIELIGRAVRGILGVAPAGLSPAKAR